MITNNYCHVWYALAIIEFMALLTYKIWFLRAFQVVIVDSKILLKKYQSLIIVRYNILQPQIIFQLEKYRLYSAL